jgi:hypothetical protein
MERRWSGRKQAALQLVAATIGAPLDVCRIVVSYSSELLCVAVSLGSK